MRHAYLQGCGVSTLKVLIVTADRLQSEALEGLFRARFGALVWTVADRAARALTLLGQDLADLIICAAELADMSGAEFFRAVRATPALREVAFILLDETVLEIPLPSPSEVVLGREAHPAVVLASASALLARRLPDARATLPTPARRAQTELRGSLEVVSLFDLVFALAQKRTTGRLCLQLEGDEASLFLHEGHPVHAAYGALTGEAAVTAIFAAAERCVEAEFSYAVGEAAPPSVTLHTPVQELLLKAAIALDRERTTP